MNYTETWLTIFGFNDYEVNPSGVIRIKGTNNILKWRLDENGYCKVDLVKGGKQFTIRVHRIVATAFINNPEKKPQVNHIDRCRTNNHVSNLEWSTAKENINHSIRQGQRWGNMKKTPVVAILANGEKKEFESRKIAADFFNTDQRRICQSVASGGKHKGIYFKNI